ncbi:uncharacterized protein LOC123310586 [Coccinella septempunctata]|uniref:uncharacterized protein LOC123310586 n=1 Tax=Coccinella septempunctata TaxID=41139 RepID=UPI001D0902A2|nr:uncharacterized protein LOC123310586 [Coccinella septempunctata]
MSEMSESQVDDLNSVMSPTSSEVTNTIVNEKESSITSPSLCLSSVNAGKKPRRNLKKKYTSLADEVLKKVSQQLSSAEEDKFETSAKNFANKLRSLSPQTAIVTEKLLSDVLFEAQMGNVGRHTKVVLQNTQPQHTETVQYQQLGAMSNNAQQYYSTFTSQYDL